MKMTRQKFLLTVVAGVAGAALRPLSAIAIPAGGFPMLRDFGGFIGQTFHVQTADGRGSIHVVLETYEEQAPSNGTHQFSLTFFAPGGGRLAEGIYSVEQARMGRFDLFVMPTRRDGQGRAFYRADFNLLVRK